MTDGIEDMAFDEIERIITDSYLASYKQFKFNFARMDTQPEKVYYIIIREIKR